MSELREVNERTPSRVPSLAAVKPMDVATEAASSPAREILSNLRLMGRSFACCTLLFPKPGSLLGNFRSPLTHRRAHDPVTRLPCCACAVAHICVLGFSTGCCMDIPSVCQFLQMLTGSQTSIAAPRPWRAFHPRPPNRTTSNLSWRRFSSMTIFASTTR